MRRVTRLCSPPFAWTRFWIIQEAADPQTTRMTSFWRDTQVFQKCSSAEQNFARLASSHGSSSRKTTRFVPLRAACGDSRNRSSCANASCHEVGTRGATPRPMALPSASAKFSSCSDSAALCRPVSSKQTESPKNSLTRNVFPTRRRP